jgi:hypothetical protein
MIIYRTKYYSLPYQKIFVNGVFAGRVRAAAMEKMPEYLKKKIEEKSILPWEQYSVDKLTKRLAKYDRKTATKISDFGKDFYDQVTENHFKRNNEVAQKMISNVNEGKATKEDEKLLKKIMKDLKKDKDLKILNHQTGKGKFEKTLRDQLGEENIESVPLAAFPKNHPVNKSLNESKDVIVHTTGGANKPDGLLHEYQHILDSRNGTFDFDKYQNSLYSGAVTSGKGTGPVYTSFLGQSPNPDFYRNANNIHNFKRNVIGPEANANRAAVMNAYLKGASKEQLQRFYDRTKGMQSTYEAFL